MNESNPFPHFKAMESLRLMERLQLGWFKVTTEQCLACKQSQNIDAKGERFSEF